MQPTALIRISEDTGEPIRGKNGLCIRCKPGESGMFVGKILAHHPMRDFAGYSDLNASQKKVAHNVLVKGDSFFLSGDILFMDELGYLYFKDRTGDTFRWRGENVSTTEVEAVISNAVGLRDCCVYGVQVRILIYFYEYLKVVSRNLCALSHTEYRRYLTVKGGQGWLPYWTLKTIWTLPD